MSKDYNSFSIFLLIIIGLASLAIIWVIWDGIKTLRSIKDKKEGGKKS